MSPIAVSSFSVTADGSKPSEIIVSSIRKATPACDQGKTILGLFSELPHSDIMRNKMGNDKGKRLLSLLLIIDIILFKFD